MANETTPTPQKPDSAPPGWYPDPYRIGDLSTEWYWNGTLWQGERRKPDIKGLRPTWLTLGTIILGFVATWMAVPFVQQFSEVTSPHGVATGGWYFPNGWQLDLWGVAFVVGSISFVLALVSQRKERRRRSRSGRLCAGLAVAVACIGAYVWSLPVVLPAWGGL